MQLTREKGRARQKKAVENGSKNFSGAEGCSLSFQSIKCKKLCQEIARKCKKKMQPTRKKALQKKTQIKCNHTAKNAIWPKMQKKKNAFARMRPC